MTQPSDHGWSGGAAGPPGGWGQPARAPVGPPPKKSNTLIWVLVAVFVLLLLVVPCVIVGLGALGGVFYATTARRHADAIETLASGGGSSSGVAPTTSSAAAADPRDSAFGAFLLDATRAIESAARGLPHDSRWDSVRGADSDLRRPQPENATVLAPLGAWTVVATAVEVEAIAPSPGGSGYVRSNVLVFADGRVRWSSIEARVQPQIFVRPTVGIAQIAPPLSAQVDRMIEALRAPSCVLPTASPGEIVTFPPALQRDSNAAFGLRTACSTVVGLGATTAWQPRYDDITVLVSGNGGWATLRSGFEVTAGRLTLGPVRARAVR